MSFVNLHDCPVMFSTLHALSEPMPVSDEHYKCFSDLYGTTTDESHRPSLQKQSKKKTLPFASSFRHVKNVDMMLKCEHCGSWRLLYCEQKLTKERKLGTSINGCFLYLWSTSTGLRTAWKVSKCFYLRYLV